MTMNRQAVLLHVSTLAGEVRAGLPVTEAMGELAASFPTIARRPDTFQPWDAVAFAEAWATGSGGEKDAALFVLSVWDPANDWSEFGLTRGGERGGRFDVHRALGNWDNEHRAAFVDWASDPWWA
jgi:hypothetical protein